jgi:alpha-L-rhamnosidase
MELVPEGKRDRVTADLRERLKRDKNHLKTGFIGTPYFCKVLSENGCNDLAYTLLLNKDYPSWLYAVTMGATTIWERWNSVLPDGRISGTDMNSLNHYAYGSIVEWMYRYMAGINPMEDKPGFRRVKIAPQPDYRLKYAKASYNSAVGLYESQWEISEEGNLSFKFTIPFNASAEIILPNAKLENVKINCKYLKDTFKNAAQASENVSVELTSGSYEFFYEPEVSYIKYYSSFFSYKELVENEETKKALVETLPRLLPDPMVGKVGDKSPRDLARMPFFQVPSHALDELDKKLGQIKVIVN